MTFELLESRAMLSGQTTTIHFNDLSNLTTPNKIYVGGWINAAQAVQSSITQVAKVVKQSGVTPAPPTPTPSSSLTITPNTGDYYFDPHNPAVLTINGTGFGSVPSANTIVFYEDAAGTTLSPVNPNGAAGPFWFSIPDGTDTSLTVAFDATVSGHPQPSAGPLYAQISTKWAYPLQADGTFATNPSPAVPFYDVASLAGGVSLDTATNGNDRLVFVAAPVRPTATSSQTPWSNYPITVLPQNTATVPPGPFGFMEFGYDAQFNTSYVDSFGLNWAFVDDATPDVVYGVRPTIDRSTIQTAYDTFTGLGTGTGGDPLGQPFNQLLWKSTTTPVPAVVDGQFTAIVSPKDWIANPPSNADVTALTNYWTSTVNEFFTDGNQLSISLNGTAYTGTASGGTYTLQPHGVVIAKADYAGTAIFAQPQPDNSSVTGQLRDAVFEAFSRGVSLDGVWKAGRSGSPPAGYSSDAWTNYANWYKPGETTYDPHINRTYDVYAKFFHYATSEGNDFRDVHDGKPMLGLNPAGYFAMAYGFSLDESPSVNTAGGGTWPTKASVNGGTTIGKGGSITVTFGPWVAPTSPTVTAIDTASRQDDQPTTAATVTWTVNFSQPVSGVTPANFTLASAATLSGCSITEVKPGSSGSTSQTWTVTATTGTGYGLLGLNMTSASGVKNAKNDPLHLTPTPWVGQKYDVDRGAVATLTIPGDAQNPTDAATVVFDVAFTEAVTGLTPANFAPVQAGGVAGATVQNVVGAGKVWTVTVATGSGSGTLGLTLANDTGLTPSVKVPVSSSQVYTIDKHTPSVAPEISAIDRAGANPTSAASVSWTVSFSEPVTGVSAVNFSLVSGSGLGGSAAITTITPASTSSTATWIVTASGYTGSGTLGLNLTDAIGIKDAEEQPLSNVPPDFTGAVYTIDRTAPAVTAINRTSAEQTSLPSVSWQVEFSKPVSGVSRQNFQLIVGGGLKNTGITNVSGSGTTWAVTAKTGSGSGTLTLDMVNVTGITDAVELPPTGVPFVGQQYEVDRKTAPIDFAPTAFWATVGQASPLVWPRGLTPFVDGGSVQLDVTLAVSGEGALQAASAAGVMVSGSGGNELTFTGTVTALDAYFRQTGRMTYTPAASSLDPRFVTLSSQGSDGLTGGTTSVILVKSSTPPSPAPAVTAAGQLGPVKVGRPLEISYAQLAAATGATPTTDRSLQFMLSALQSGRLEVQQNGEWHPVLTPSLFVPNPPLLTPGGLIRWTPATATPGTLDAFQVKVFDGSRYSAAAQVQITTVDSYQSLVWDAGAFFVTATNASRRVLDVSARSQPVTLSVDLAAAAYLIDGIENPTIEVSRGQTYHFDLNVPGEPFTLQTVDGGYDPTFIYNEGFAGNGETSGQFAWVVPETGPEELFYQSASTPEFGGKIIVGRLPLD